MQWLLFIILPLFCFSFLDAATVLITGANRGIGLEFANQYKKKGYDVIGTARKPEEASELRALGARVEQLDVADEASIRAMAKRLEGVPIDILINNAGILIGRNTSLEALDFENLRDSFAVNAIGPILVTKSLLPNLRAGKERKIVNITSHLGSIERNSGGLYAYRASKAALNQFTKTVSIELAGEGFICIAIHPGWVRTEMGGPMATYSTEQSVRAMIKVIDKLDQRHNGSYVDLDSNRIPW